MTLLPVTTVVLAGIDVSGWIDRDGYKPTVGDLGGFIDLVEIRLVDPAGDIPITPANGLEVVLKDSLDQVVFGGWLSELIAEPLTKVRTWTLHCLSWASRLAETATGSLNKVGVVDSDRAFMIAIITDGLQARSFGSDSVGIDDPIVVANAAINWGGIQETTRLAGADWSYRQTLDCVRDLIGRVPGASLRIRPADKIVEYGMATAEAPFVLAGFPTAGRMQVGHVAEIVAGTYQEDEITAGHFNRVRLGGLGAAEVIAVDQVSHGRFGRILDRPYENDESIAAVDLEREAYARLAAAPVRRVARATITDDGLRPGMVVRVCVDELGAFEDFGVFFDQFSFVVPTDEDEPTDAYRGEFVVQKVTPTFLAPGVQAYALELGDYVPDLEHVLAERLG